MKPSASSTRMDDADAEADLAVYRAQYGLPACTTANGCFTKLNQTGGTSPLPPSGVSSGWVLETGLDLEMVSATCPLCHIVLIEANTNQWTDIVVAVDPAAAKSNAVSNSYGGPEFSGYASSTTIPGCRDGRGLRETGKALNAGAANCQRPFRLSQLSEGPCWLTTSSTHRRFQRDRLGRRGQRLQPLCGEAYVSARWRLQQPHHRRCRRRCVRRSPMYSETLTAVGCRRLRDKHLIANRRVDVHGCAGQTSTYTDAPRLYTRTHQTCSNITTGQNGTCSTAYLCQGTVGYDGPTGLGNSERRTGSEASSPHLNSLGRRRRSWPRPVTRTRSAFITCSAHRPIPGSSPINSYTATCTSSNRSHDRRQLRHRFTDRRIQRHERRHLHVHRPRHQRLRQRPRIPAPLRPPRCAQRREAWATDLGRRHARQHVDQRCTFSAPSDPGSSPINSVHGDLHL